MAQLKWFGKLPPIYPSPYQCYESAEMENMPRSRLTVNARTVYDTCCVLRMLMCNSFCTDLSYIMSLPD